eukprot:5584971-Amphidinium_carterae.1
MVLGRKLLDIETECLPILTYSNRLLTDAGPTFQAQFSQQVTGVAKQTQSIRTATVATQSGPAA